MGVPSVPFHPLATRVSDIEPRRRSWLGSNERNNSSGEARRGGNAMASPSAAELAARLDRLPMTRHIWVLVTLISLGGGFELYDLFLTAYIARGLVKTNFFTPEPRGSSAYSPSMASSGSEPVCLPCCRAVCRRDVPGSFRRQLW